MTDLTLEPYAARLQWRFARPFDGREWGELLVEHVELLATNSAKFAASMIGHIKGLAVAPGDGYIRINLVSPFMPADVECQIAGRHGALTFDLNVLIYGLTLEQVRQLTADAAENVATRLGGQVDIESKHYEHVHVGSQ